MKSEPSHGKMKVTVCFDDVRVVVPCKSGEMLIRDLMDDAIVRYKKAAGLPSEHKVCVHHLILGVDGGILYEGDRVVDVVEDRDQIIADFQRLEPEPPGPSHLFGLMKDLTRSQYGKTVSGKSALTASKSSPEFSEFSQLQPGGDVKIRPTADLNSNWMTNASGKNCDAASSDVMESRTKHRNGLATGNTVSPSENKTDVSTGQHLRHHNHQQVHQQFSTPILKRILKKTKDESPKKTDANGQESRIADQSNLTESNSDSPVTSPEIYSSFVRDSSRKSLSNQLVMSKWLDAQERTVDAYEAEQSRQDQKRPISQPVCVIDDVSTPQNKDFGARLPDVLSDLVSGPGLHQLRNRNNEPSASSWRSSFYEATSSSTSPVVSPQYQSLTLRKKRQAPEPPTLETSKHQLRSKSPSAISPNYSANVVGLSAKPDVSMPSILVTSPSVKCGKAEMVDTRSNTEVVGDGVADSTKSTSEQKSINKLTPSKKGVLAPTNTRLIGTKIGIQLLKGSNGLGFSITTRDNVAGNECPIYIKNILPMGAAVEDGRLMAGDRLLEVNGIEMTGKTQSEAVQVLRSIPINGSVEILVSRQVVPEDDIEPLDNSNTTSLAPKTEQPEPIESTASQENTTNVRNDNSVHESQVTNTDMSSKKTVTATSSDAEKEMQLLTFKFPLSTSLRISFYMARQDGRDVGIFVKKVTLKDCPLLVNDQVIEVNGTLVLGLSNSKAIEIVKEALKNEADIGVICVKVARNKTVDSNFYSSIMLDKETGTGDANTSLVSQSSDGLRASKNLSSRGGEVSGGEAPSFSRGVTEVKNMSADSTSKCQSSEHGLADEGVIADFIPDESFDQMESTPGFNREGFGRQSISEKRKGHADPSNFDIFQKIKLNKEEKLDYNSVTWDPRKSTLHKSAEQRRDESFKGSKRCKSLENLHVLSQTETAQEVFQDIVPSTRINKQSFLIAVDRSYDLPDRNTVIAAEGDVDLSSRESFLTLRKAPLFPGLTKADKKKNDMDKIRSIIKKGTDMFRFSTKRRRSAESKDPQDSRSNLSRTRQSIFWVTEPILDDGDQNSGLVTPPTNPRPSPRRDTTKPCVSRHTSELEVTHFGADCITTVITQDISNPSEFPMDRRATERRSGNPPNSKINKLQQLRAEHQQLHKERQGHYPRDSVEDRFEQQLLDEERNWYMSQQTGGSVFDPPSPTKLTNDRPHHAKPRARPQPISAHPELSAQFECYDVNSVASSGYLSHYDLQDAYNPSLQSNCPTRVVGGSYFYGFPADDPAFLGQELSAESKRSANRKSLAVNYDHVGVGQPTASTVYDKQKSERRFVHDRQKSSPVPSSPTILPTASGDRRHSFSEKLPAPSVCHLEVSYNHPPTRLAEFGGVVTQSSRV